MRHHTPAIVVFAIAAAIVGRSTATTYGNEATDSAKPAPGSRIVTNFNAGWRFEQGDTKGAEAVEFDDSDWTAVRLPHDWAISGPFDPEEHGFAAKLPWKDLGWYRKTFTLDGPNNGRRVYLDFDGVMAFPQVYVNGKLAGEWDYGYMSFRVDATPHVKFGGPNVVAVRVDTRKHGTRWYPGAGIYRKVTLTICNPIHLAHWATFVTTPEVNDDEATVNVQTTIENHTDKPVDVDLNVFLQDPAPTVNELFDTRLVSAVPAHGSSDVELSLCVKKPERWEVTNPQLYRLQVAVDKDMSPLASGNRHLDLEEICFGIRTFKLTPNDGFHLNGRRVQLYGVNLHHDHGPLGAAFYRRAMERQLEIMRDIGVNAIRTSHNPPSPELLDLCDRMGFVVWDECFDKWNHTAGRHDGTPPLKEYCEKQIRNFVMRDRNHPSVVVWSIGNEIPPAPGDPEGLTAERVKFMRDCVRRYDDTRPVGLGHHIVETAATNILDSLDFTGWNYGRRYLLYRQRYPNKPIIYSESASALSTRGFYELPLPMSKTEFSRQGQVDSYDYNSARWSDIADVEFDLMERDRFVAGEFVWTGFDYLGEPTPFEQEAVSSYFGIVDLCGLPKDRYFLYRSYWRPDVPTVHILPHWNWPVGAASRAAPGPPRLGGPTRVPVFVYTNGDSAELFLNGRSLGRREKLREVPPRTNIAEGKPIIASSTGQSNHLADHAADGNNWTRWRAAESQPGEWLQVDLGAVQPVREVSVVFDGAPGGYQYRIKASDDGENWQLVAEHDEFAEYWAERLSHSLDTTARFVRIEFTRLRDANVSVGIREVFVYPTSYYAVTDKYRLKWLDVAYEPGELKAVAYKDGKRVGEAMIRTAGPPTAIRLTPDRTTLEATGEDLCYVTVEALDENGTLCPLADNLVRFHVEGPAEIVGVGNGNPRSYEPFQASERKLFYGKAMLIVRTREGQGGKVRIDAESDGLKPAQVTVTANRRTQY